MAKDGTARGSNIKVNAGRRSKGLAEKIAAGNPGKRKLKIIDIPDGADLDTSEMPEPSSYLKSKQKAGGEFDAEDIYRTMGKIFTPERGWAYYIISPDEDFEKCFGRKADKRRKLYNGMIKCQLFMYFK